ncbi:MAG: F0F1 ATP synthase subunit gamma [Minisyncoccia bacterium]
MSRIAELKKTLDEYEAAEITAGALEDISGLRMQSIRAQFEKNRSFYEEIRALYGVVQAQGKRIGGDQQKAKKPRELFVAITSNKRFYGSLIRDIIQALSARLAQSAEGSCLIVGSVGWQYFEQFGARKGSRQMVLADDTPTPQEFETLLRHFSGFDRIYVFYPKFINPFRQDVGVEDITESPAVGAVAASTAEMYLFEPEVSLILAFFDTQVRRVLFGRVLLEAELSRTAARLIKMEEAEGRAQKLVSEQRTRIRRETAAASNTQLLETFAGFTQWSHR